MHSSAYNTHGLQCFKTNAASQRCLDNTEWVPRLEPQRKLACQGDLPKDQADDSLCFVGGMLGLSGHLLDAA